jgi:hypothetical protein
MHHIKALCESFWVLHQLVREVSLQGFAECYAISFIIWTKFVRQAIRLPKLFFN